MVKRKKTKPTNRGGAVRPTRQRLKHGVWATPKGTMQSQQPIVDMASDIIGQLYEFKAITSRQEQAARMFETARVAYIKELPDISGYKSCIAGGIHGHDCGDGDAQVIAIYRGLERRIGTTGRTNLILACDGFIPTSMQSFKDALNILAS